MNKAEFKKIVGETLKSQGFAYENKYQTSENTDLKIFIGFQKSNFENSFYINYDFFIKKLYEKSAIRWEWDYLQEQHGYNGLKPKGGYWYGIK